MQAEKFRRLHISVELGANHIEIGHTGEAMARLKCGPSRIPVLAEIVSFRKIDRAWTCRQVDSRKLKDRLICKRIVSRMK